MYLWMNLHVQIVDWQLALQTQLSDAFNKSHWFLVYLVLRTSVINAQLFTCWSSNWECYSCFYYYYYSNFRNNVGILVWERWCRSCLFIFLSGQIVFAFSVLKRKDQVLTIYSPISIHLNLVYLKNDYTHWKKKIYGFALLLWKATI